MRKRDELIGLALMGMALTAAGLACASDRRGDFTFRDAEFMTADRGVSAATDFVASDLPPGLTFEEARRRLVRADMSCTAPTRCDFTELVHIDGGVIGEDHYVVRLTNDGRGTLTSAVVDHFTTGVGQPNP